MIDNNIQFAPFHVINAFMRPDYRSSVVQSTLNSMSDLSEERRKQINQLCKRFISVPGFRSSLAAPAALKIKPYISVFEKNPSVVAVTLQAWSEQHLALRQEVYDLLTQLDWKLLPADADRSKLPGFLPTWPPQQDFETVYAAYNNRFPESTSSSDDVSLMVVWLSGRIPYEDDEDEAQE